MLCIEKVYESIIDGGLHAGVPAVFVKFKGDPLDKENEFIAKNRVGVPLLLDGLHRYSPSYIYLCGGDPLFQPHNDFFSFLNALPGWSRLGLKGILLRTSGATSIDWMFTHTFSSFVSLILDYKLSSTGYADRMIARNLNILRERDVLNFHCNTMQDFEEALEILETRATESRFKPIIYFYAKERKLEEALIGLILVRGKLKRRYDVRIGRELSLQADIVVKEKATETPEQ